jgi:hypothetical protein
MTVPPGVRTSTERVAASVLDVRHFAGDRIGVSGGADRRFLRTDGHGRAAIGERQLLRAEQPDPRTGQRHAVAVVARDVELEHVAIAHEAGDVQVRRLQVDLFRRRNLLRHAIFHHDDAIGERKRLVLVVRDIDRRPAKLAVDTPDFGASLDAELRIQVRQWLVHQHERRLDDDRARDRHALLLAAG